MTAPLLSATLRFKHVSWRTASLERALGFYVLLGGQLLKREQTPEGWGRATLLLGGVRVQLFEMPDLPPPPAAQHWADHIALEVPDITALVGRLEGQGHTLSRPLEKRPSGRLMAFVLDPDGRQVELLEKRPEPGKSK